MLEVANSLALTNSVDPNEMWLYATLNASLRCLSKVPFRVKMAKSLLLQNQKADDLGSGYVAYM